LAIASFAYKVFQVTGDHLYTIDDFQYSSSLQTEKQDAEGTKPSTYNKGPDLDSMSFKIKLDVGFDCHPRIEWEDWKSLLNSGVSYPFILGGKPLGYYNWLLIGVTPSDFNIDNAGNIIALDLELKFEEYVRAGAKKETSSESSGNTSSSSKGKTSSSKSKSSGSTAKGKSIEALSDSQFESLIED
jgi:hypothetical protein